MTGRSIAALVLLLSFLISPSAIAEVNVEPGVYKKTTQRWKAAISLSSFNSDSWLWKLGIHDRKHENNSRDSILLIPKNALPDDITLVIWFHGCSGFSQKTFNNRIIGQFTSIIENNHSVAIAVPEMPWSINTSTTCGRQGRVWRSNFSLQKYVDNLHVRLSRWASSEHEVPLGTVRTVVIGHSAGGSAIMSASLEGSLCSIKPEAVVWSDATYGRWLQRAWSGCMSGLGFDLHVVVRKWDKPHYNTRKFMRNIQRNERSIFYKVLDRKRWKHGGIGDNIINLTNIFPPGC